MWNIRMRASQKSRGRKENLKPGSSEMHISGAEGIFEKTEIARIVNEYINRAFTHPRGRPDEIVITVEGIKQRTAKAALLPLTTRECNSPDEARRIICRELSGLGVSNKALNNAFRVLCSAKTMRGASLIFMESGRRAEPDRNRGVRVSRLGMQKSCLRRLLQRLSKMRINTTTVKEALMLASKVASCPGVIAEACISDDPDYSTGYIASRKTGYMRIPNIKNQGDLHGGRVFFIRENADIKSVTGYLEKTPVIIC